jgi:hypothetical protein
MSEEDFEKLREDMERQGRELRESLAETLGGEPEDYRVDRAASTEGG